MSDANDGTPPDRCHGVEEVVRLVVDRLRDRRDELAAALGGRALSVEVAVEPTASGPLRIGFASEGFVTTLSASNPLTLGFSPHVVIRGSASDVVRILTAPEPTRGEIRLSAPEAWARYARVHRIVAPELRAAFV